MSKVLFTINYEIEGDKKEEYLKTIRELKSLIKAEGLESYSVYEVKGKPDRFQEQYIFSSDEAFENFEDATDERINILITKISGMTIEHSTKYTTLIELL
ncbi:MAG: MFS transporter [Ignavibacteriaceae bacterium]|nr:MFS transporter [Ignavibacteriaceae bacterium]